MIEKYGTRVELSETSSPIPIHIETDFADLVPESLKEWREDATKLSRLLEDEHFDAIRRIGHDFKGAGKPYGFVELTRLGDEIEQLARQEDNDRLARPISEVQAYLARVFPVFDRPSRRRE
jgi:HPt (histidine-containing phosphotransfer) domain-containing protein